MSFSFLNHTALWALPLAALPFILHLFFRRPPRLIPFSDTRLLKLVYQDQQSVRKIKKWIILLLRFLILLFLLLFFSRPIFHWGGKLSQGDSLSIVILLDASYSMQTQNHGISDWDKMVGFAEKSVGALTEKDRSALIVFSDRIEFISPYFSNHHSDILKKIFTLKPTYRETQIIPALQQAYQLLSQNSSGQKAILILSDMTKNGWVRSSETKSLAVRDIQGQIQNFDPSIQLIYVDRKKEYSNNYSIQNVQFLSDFYHNTFNVQLNLKNWTDQSSFPCSAAIEILSMDNTVQMDDSFVRQSENTFTLLSNENKDVSFALPLAQNQVVGRAILNPDDLLVDNYYYFAQSAPQRIKVLCVEDHTGISALSGNSYYLRQALTASPSIFETKIITLNEIKSIDLKSYHAIVLLNLSNIDDSLSGKLIQYHRSGGVLWFSLGGRVGFSSFKQIEEILPCDFLNIRDRLDLNIQMGSVAPEELSEISKNYELNKVKVYKIFQTQVKPQGEVWVELEDKTPLLICDPIHKVALWTSTLDRDWTNIVGKPFFVSISRKLLSFLTQSGSSIQSEMLFVGDEYKKNVDVNTSVNTISFISPSFQHVPFKVRLGQLISAPLEEPGLYSMRIGSNFNRIAVNAKIFGEENNPEQMSFKDLRMAISKSKWIGLSDNEKFLSDLKVALEGKEVSRLLLVLAALCLFLEFWITKSKK